MPPHHFAQDANRDDPSGGGSDGRDSSSHPKTTTMDYLERVFVRRQEALIVSPALDESEPARLVGGMGERVHDILFIFESIRQKREKMSFFFLFSWKPQINKSLVVMEIPGKSYVRRRHTRRAGCLPPTLSVPSRWMLSDHAKEEGYFGGPGRCLSISTAPGLFVDTLGYCSSSRSHSLASSSIVVVVVLFSSVPAGSISFPDRKHHTRYQTDRLSPVTTTTITKEKKKRLAMAEKKKRGLGKREQTLMGASKSQFSVFVSFLFFILWERIKVDEFTGSTACDAA